MEKNIDSIILLLIVLIFVGGCVGDNYIEYLDKKQKNNYNLEQSKIETERQKLLINGLSEEIIKKNKEKK